MFTRNRTRTTKAPRAITYKGATYEKVVSSKRHYVADAKSIIDSRAYKRFVTKLLKEMFDDEFKTTLIDFPAFQRGEDTDLSDLQMDVVDDTINKILALFK